MIGWREIKLVGGTAAAVVSVVTAWNLAFLPFLNSDFSPVVGAQKFQSSQKIQQDTVSALGKIGSTVESVVTRLDRTNCIDWNRRYRNAIDALSKDRFDSNAEYLRDLAVEQINSIPGCMYEPMR